MLCCVYTIYRSYDQGYNLEFIASSLVAENVAIPSDILVDILGPNLVIKPHVYNYTNQSMLQCILLQHVNFKQIQHLFI